MHNPFSILGINNKDAKENIKANNKKYENSNEKKKIIYKTHDINDASIEDLEAKIRKYDNKPMQEQYKECERKDEAFTRIANDMALLIEASKSNNIYCEITSYPK